MWIPESELKRYTRDANTKQNIAPIELRICREATLSHGRKKSRSCKVYYIDLHRCTWISV